MTDRTPVSLPRSTLVDRVLLLGLVAIYLAISLHGLAVVPPVYADEPWQASTGWKLAREGVFGSDMFAGLHGMEQRYYGYMPVHPLLLAITFKLAGLGLFQARLETVTMGLLTLLLTWLLGRRLFDERVATMAVAILLFVRLTFLTRYQLSGILLLDMARIARYDMVVPVFGLASLYVYLTAARKQHPALYALAGALAALAGLSHLYGVFWIIVLAILAVWDGAAWRSVAMLGIGFALPWVPYGAYVLGDPQAWAAQTRGYAPRFDLLNPAWYWSNLLNERFRYAPGLGPPGPRYLLRPGLWATVVGLPTALFFLTRRAIRRGDQAARAVVVPLFVFPPLFAVLIWLKLVNYLVTVVPLAALLMAWGAMTLWRWSGEEISRRWVRVACTVLAIAVVAEGAGRIAALEAAGARATPYADFITAVRAHIPPQSRVLGLQDYWFGLDDLDYRSWAVPLIRASENEPSPIPDDIALAEIAPSVILIDWHMREFFAGAPARERTIREWMTRSGFELTATVEDPTYRRMEIYRRAGSK